MNTKRQNQQRNPQQPPKGKTTVQGRNPVVQEVNVAIPLTGRRNRRRNRNTNVGVAQPSIVVPYNSLDSPNQDFQNLRRSFLEQYQTVFYPTRGAFKGTSTGLEPTTIGSIHGTIDVVGSATNPWLCFGVTPGTLYGPVLAFNSATAGVNPYTSPQVAVQGPFVTTPGSTVGTSARALAMEVNIIPTGAPMYQSGQGGFAYTNDMSVTPWASMTSDVLNFPMSSNFDPGNGISMHWVPGPGDDTFSKQAGIIQLQSGMFGYIYAGSANVTYRVEYTLVFEYIVTTAFLPFIPKGTSTTHPDTAYYIGKTAFDYYNPLVFDTYSSFTKRLSGHKQMQGGFNYNRSSGQLALASSNVMRQVPLNLYQAENEERKIGDEFLRGDLPPHGSLEEFEIVKEHQPLSAWQVKQAEQAYRSQLAAQDRSRVEKFSHHMASRGQEAAEAFVAGVRDGTKLVQNVLEVADEVSRKASASQTTSKAGSPTKRKGDSEL